MLPTFKEITKWSDEQVKCVYELLFIKDVDPSFGEPREEVDEYFESIKSEFEHRKLVLDKKSD